MLKYTINAKSTQESNIFLRKLWSELNDIRPMGWNMYPGKTGNHITIGRSNLGEISFDYGRKGCIKNLYIDNNLDAEDITLAVQNAKSNDLSEYTVLLELKSDRDIQIMRRSYGKCSIYSKDGCVFLLLGYKAYSTWDANQTLPSKYLPLIAVLYEYTHRIFKLQSGSIAKQCFRDEDTPPIAYNYHWLDTDECPLSEDNQTIIPDECLKLLTYIMDDEEYIEDIELLLNSSRILFTTYSLMEEITFPYASCKADIINSLVCSSFEPLSLILDKNTDQCSVCGNKIFSISKKIKTMCTRYFGEDFARLIINVLYTNRSIFFHMGQTETTQRATPISCPQINPVSGMIMFPVGKLRYDAFDYSTFLFRSIARDYYSGAI